MFTFDLLVSGEINGLMNMCFIVEVTKLKIIIYEPPCDKTNSVAVRPAKTQISLGICPV